MPPCRGIPKGHARQGGDMTDAERVLKSLCEDKDRFFDFGLDEAQNRVENKKYNDIVKDIFVPCNFEVWMKKKLWTEHEASVIILGLEPSIFLGYEQRYFYLKDNYKSSFLHADFQIYCEIAYITAKRTALLKEIERGVMEKTINAINSVEQAYVDASSVCHFFMERGTSIPDALINFAKENIDPVKVWEDCLAKEQDLKTKKYLSAYFKRNAQGMTWKEVAAEFGVDKRSPPRWMEEAERFKQEKGLPPLPALKDLQMS